MEITDRRRWMKEHWLNRLVEGKAVVDEECHCGHPCSEHDELFRIGDGRCLHEGCKCSQFIWVGFIFGGDDQESLPEREDQ